MIKQETNDEKFNWGELLQLKNLKSRKDVNLKQRYIPIRIKLILFFILFAIIPVSIISLVSTQISSKVVRKNSENLSLEMVKQTAVNANYFINQVETAINNIGTNLTMTSGLVNALYVEDETKSYNSGLSINQQLAAVPTTDKNIKKLTMILSEEEIFGSKLSIDIVEVLNHPTIQNSYDYVWKIKSKENTEVMWVIKKLPYIFADEDLQDKKVIMVAEVNIGSMFTNMKDINLLDQARMSLLSEDKEVLYSTDEDMTVMRDDILDKILELQTNKQTEDEAGEDKDEVTQALNGTGMTKDHTLLNYATLQNGWMVVMHLPENTLIKDLTESTGIIVGFIVLFVILAIIVGSIVARSYSNPIIKLMNYMKMAEQGDLTVTSVLKGNDETTQLCKSFNHMLSNINHQFGETKNVIISTLDDSQTLRNMSKISVEAMEQLSISIHDISSGAMQQTEDNQDSINVMASLADSIQEVLYNVNNISNSNQIVQKKIENANSDMALLTDSMKSSIQITNTVSESIEQLSELTKSIDNIMNFVDSISEETNLLALNATIEAARAGEAGKGFAVVAQEIRKMAEQSKLSTINVKETLNKIDNKTKDTVELVYKSNEIYEKQNDSLNKTIETFVSVFNALKMVDQELEKINCQANTMNTLKTDMALKVENIAAITEETAASTQEVNALSENQKDASEKLYILSNKLSSTMDSLKESIEKFQV